MTENQQQALNNLASLINDYTGHLDTLGHPTAANAVRAVAQRSIEMLQREDSQSNEPEG